MLLIHPLWVLITVLRFAGVVIVFAGVALFGVYFIGGNMRPAKSGGAISALSWQGIGPKRGLRIVAFGVLMLICAFALGLFLPTGT